MKTLDWRNLYGESWAGEITPDAFAHPAKFSRALIRQIYKFLADEGMIHAGDTVVDPFGGVALGALEAMRLGLTWVGVELEAKFVALGNANIDLWNKRYMGNFKRWGTARLVQGDSRELLDVIANADCAVSSPPFQESLGDKPSAGLLAGSGGRMGKSQKNNDVYGTTPGQLCAMRTGSFEAAVSSPPYEA